MEFMADHIYWTADDKCLSKLSYRLIFDRRSNFYALLPPISNPLFLLSLSFFSFFFNFFQIGEFMKVNTLFILYDPFFLSFPNPIIFSDYILNLFVLN